MTSTITAILAALTLLSASLSASDMIVPYKESGKSGLFHYAIYNNRWLLHGKQGA